MVRRSRGRIIDGIVLLDKPVGMTSNAALQAVKRAFRARKAGHTGSLDPLASGLLPICLGAATKLSPFLLESDKRYLVTVRLGIKTTTGDAEGDLVEHQEVAGFSDERVDEVLMFFHGAIQQVPPMHSAIKHKGQPLYKLAHRGIEIERQARTVRIDELRLLRNEGETLELEVACSKGTYVRTLAEDIGVALGTVAHVAALRRTGVGPFADTQSVTLEAVETLAEENHQRLSELLLPMESALAAWPDVCLSEDMAYYMRQGQAVFVPRAPTSGWVKLRDARQRFLGVGCVLADGRVAPKRLLGSTG
ncbi:MAG TPA: tRNA pseudouridine(55) synthase TruB [Gammaproteobacteria bacterium]|nr:tRNA pseudouridine(55) synthase TruB [Gammaproteobacteria bacterium]